MRKGQDLFRRDVFKAKWKKPGYYYCYCYYQFQSDLLRGFLDPFTDWLNKARYFSSKSYCTTRDVIVDLANEINNNCPLPTSQNRLRFGKLRLITYCSKLQYRANFDKKFIRSALRVLRS